MTVTCGGTEAMMATMLGLVDPGDEIIIFEPFYENYGPDTLISGGKPMYVPLRRVGDEFRFDPDELRKAFSSKTKAMVITTPHNPCGKVFSDEELGVIAELCQEFDALVFSDEPYEPHHLRWAEAPEHCVAARDGGADRDCQQRVQDLQRDGLAHRVGDSDGRNAVYSDTSGARLPDGRGGAPLADGGGQRHELSTELLRRPGV